MKVKVRISESKWYPVYDVEIDDDGQFLVEEEDLERWESIFRQFDKLQHEMEELYTQWYAEATAGLHKKEQ